MSAQGNCCVQKRHFLIGLQDDHYNYAYLIKSVFFSRSALIKILRRFVVEHIISCVLHACFILCYIAITSCYRAYSRGAWKLPRNWKTMPVSRSLRDCETNLCVTTMAKDCEFDSPSSHEGYGFSYMNTNDIQFFESSPLMSNNVTVEE